MLFTIVFVFYSSFWSLFMSLANIGGLFLFSMIWTNQDLLTFLFPENKMFGCAWSSEK